MKLAKVVQGVLSLPLRWRANRLDRPLPPPTDRERALIGELRAGLARAASENRESVPWWAEAQERLRRHAQEGDPRTFTRWDVIQQTMFEGNRLSLREELRSLQGDRDWASLWRPAIQESPYGWPPKYLYYTDSSGNLIHHAYHLQQVAKRLGKPVSSLREVFEFGGGYGSMRRLAHNLGFRGRYTIVDLPPFSQLQRFYLKLLGIPVDGEVTEGAGTVLSTDPGIIGTLSPGPGSLFLATWSLSETPESLRVPFLGFVGKFECFLIAYQDHFSEVDNVAFFSRWKKELSGSFECEDWPITHLPGNRYFFGKRRS